MRLLYLVPKLIGYHTNLGSDVKLTQMTSGMPRRRRTQTGVVHKASCGFTLKSVDFDYLMAFWRLTRAEIFACRVITDSSQMQWRACRWDDVPTVSYNGGGVFEFSCKVVVGSVVNLAQLKYASHLYPVFEQDIYLANVRVLVSEIKQMYKQLNLIESYVNTALPKTSLLKQTYFYRVYTHTEPESYDSNANVISSLLKQVYWDPKYIAQPESYNSAVLINQSLLKQVYFYLKHIQIEPDSYNTNTASALTSRLTKVV